MLTPPTPFPHIGSYALLIDRDRPPPQGAELVRILGYRFKGNETFVLAAFPLRTGAGGNKEVPQGELIDFTPLSDDETAELARLAREMAGRKVGPRSTSGKAKQARLEALRSRTIWSNYAAPLLARAHEIEAKRRAA